MRARWAMALAAAASLAAGCAAPPPSPDAGPAAPGRRYQCEQGWTFSVRFVDNSAVLDAGARGREVLLRDAGGFQPQHTVWTNERMRAEFGLGADGREALVAAPVTAPPARCIAR